MADRDDEALVERVAHHHRVTITLEEGYPSYQFTCAAPADSLCHADWSCECEQLYDAQVRNGVPAHRPDWDDPDTWHAGAFKADLCGLKEWFDGSDDHPLDGEFTVPVEAVWEGDFYTFTVLAPAIGPRTVTTEQVQAWMNESWSDEEEHGESAAYIAEKLSATVLAPAIGPDEEAAVERVARAILQERAFAAGCAFGVPSDAVGECARLIARAALKGAIQNGS